MEQMDRRKREQVRERRMEILLLAKATAACQSDDPSAVEFLRELAADAEEETEEADEPVPAARRPRAAESAVDPAAILMMRPELEFGVSRI
jgi:hypothetical protein